MQNQGSDYQAVRREIACRMRRRLVFFLHLGFVLSIVLACFIDGKPLNEVVIFCVVWLPFLLAHAVYAFGFWGRIIDHYTQRELEQIQAYQKPKRSNRVRLTDDGELLTEDEDQEASLMAQNRRS